jgi:hypothetical protein
MSLKIDFGDPDIAGASGACGAGDFGTSNPVCFASLFRHTPCFASLANSRFPALTVAGCIVLATGVRPVYFVRRKLLIGALAADLGCFDA